MECYEKSGFMMKSRKMHKGEKEMMRNFIAWFNTESGEDFIILTAVGIEGAERKFQSLIGRELTEMHEIEDDDRYLAYC